MLNKDKCELLFNTMNEKYLPLMYSFVSCRVFIVLVEFRLHCVTTVTPFVFVLRSPVTQHRPAQRSRSAPPKAPTKNVNHTTPRNASLGRLC